MRRRFSLWHLLRTSLLIALSIWLVAAVAFADTIVQGLADDSNDDDEIVEIVVKINPDSGATIEAINADYGTTTVSVVLNSRQIYLLRIPEGTEDADDVAEEIADDPRVLYAEPNFHNDIPEGGGNHTWEWGGPDIAPQTDQYAVTLLQLSVVHRSAKGAGVVVAMLDTGVQVDHPALRGRLTSQRYDFIDDDVTPEDVGNGIDDDGDGATDEAVGHGTHVAGIVALVAPNAQIMPLRVLGSDGRGDIFRLTEAILYAAENGASILNLSLGTARESDLLEDVLEDVRKDHDILVVAAAGNLHSTAPQYPAAENEALAVTALDENNRLADFANHGDWIDVAAPGVSIYSAFPTDGYAWWSGTSMATPFVAGQAALLRSTMPHLSADTIEHVIRSTAQSVDAVNPDYAGLLGKGRIDIRASLTEICEDEPCQIGETLFIPLILR